MSYPNPNPNPNPNPLMSFIENKLGPFPFLIIYVVLEWIMILLLFLDGLLAFLSNQFAKLFDLRIPCLLCTRLDHLLVDTTSNFYYNDSMCHLHKKEISSLAYCHMHKKLSDIRLMCQGCLLSFATGKEFSGCQQYKPLLDVEDLKSLNDDDVNPNPSPNRCSCCGEPVKSKPSSKYVRSFSTLNLNAPAPSPRAGRMASPRVSRLLSSKGEGGMPSSWLANKMEASMATPRASRLGNKMGMASSTSRLSCLSNTNEVDLPPLKLKSLKFTEEDDISNAEINQVVAQETKALLAPEPEAVTPSLAKPNNKFLGISLDPAQMSPRWANRVSRKVESGGETNEVEGAAAALDPKSLAALYMELDEERSAAAEAANNAMAMITRLQAEKAAVQMEALQYQRMMEEQAEYDEEAIEMLRDMVLKREEEMTSLEAEVIIYREKYGDLKREGSEVCEVDVDEDYQEMRSQSMSGFSEEKSDTYSLNGGDQNEMEEPSLDFARERSYLLGLVTDLEKNLATEDPNHENQSTGTKMLAREMSMIKERLRVVEADSGFLKHAAMTMHRGEDGMKLLGEIAEHLRNLRQSNA